jgi:hypothetical protein
MSRGSNSREATKVGRGNIIRKFEFLLSERKMLTRRGEISYTAPIHPGIKSIHVR